MKTNDPVIKSFWKSETVQASIASFAISLIPVAVTISEEGLKPYLVIAVIGTALTTWKTLRGRASATAIVISPSFLPGPSSKSEAIKTAHALMEHLARID